MRSVRIVSREFDPLADIEFVPTDIVGQTTFSRRVNRVATLDGGAATIDRGFSHADRVAVYSYKPISKDHDDRARRLVEFHARVAVASRDGFFEAAVESFEPGPDENTITLLILRDLTEAE